MNATDLADLMEGAATCALWANALRSNGTGDSPDLEPEVCEFLAEDFGEPDPERPWTPEAIAALRDPCESFAQDHFAKLELYMHKTGRGWSDVGQDWALNSVGHGTGFWDRGAGTVGDELSDASKAYPCPTLLVSLDKNGEVTQVDCM